MRAPFALAFLLLLLYGGIANAITASATLTAPISDPDINTGQTFTLTIRVSCGGTGSGPCTDVVAYPQYCMGAACANFTDMTTATSGLTSNVNSVNLGSISKNSVKDANFTVTGALNNTYRVRGRSTSTNGGNSTTPTSQLATVRSPAALTATVIASPGVLDDGGNITVLMSIINTGQREAVNVTPSSLTVNAINGTAGAALLTGPAPATLNISGGATRAFGWTYAAVAGMDGGNITFGGNAIGKDNRTGNTVTSNNATSNAVEVRLQNSTLAIWDETDWTTKSIGDNVYFWANYTMANGTTINGNGRCQLSFNISGGWAAWGNMTYNTSSTPYYYNRSFATAGTYGFNASCSKAGYGVRNATGNFTISSSLASVSTGKASYAGCRQVYYRTRLFDSGNSPINESFDLNVSDPNSAVWQALAGISPNNATGVYHGIYRLECSGVPGSWLIKATVASMVSGATLFSDVP